MKSPVYVAVYVSPAGNAITLNVLSLDSVLLAKSKSHVKVAVESNVAVTTYVFLLYSIPKALSPQSEPECLVKVVALILFFM